MKAPPASSPPPPSAGRSCARGTAIPRALCLLILLASLITAGSAMANFGPVGPYYITANTLSSTIEEHVTRHTAALSRAKERCSTRLDRSASRVGVRSIRK
jgi:hypothetical protein